MGVKGGWPGSAGALGENSECSCANDMEVGLRRRERRERGDQMQLERGLRGLRGLGR